MGVHHVVQLPVGTSGALTVDGGVALIESPTNAVFVRITWLGLGLGG